MPAAQEESRPEIEMPLSPRGLAEGSLIYSAATTCGLLQDSNEWLCRTVGTKKYRPPEMKDGRAAQPPIDIYCFGLMIEKLLRQRQRVSMDGCAACAPPFHHRRRRRYHH